MTKRKVGGQSANLTLNHWKSIIVLIYLCASEITHIVEKISTKVTTLFSTSSRSKFAQKIMDVQNHWNLNFGNFKILNLGDLRQNDISMQPLWPGTKNIVKRKLMVSPKSWSWWILWIYVCSWFIYAPKVFQLHINQLVVWFLQVCVNNWLACHLS
jgi:hypothetical protein